VKITSLENPSFVNKKLNDKRQIIKLHISLKVIFLKVIYVKTREIIPRINTFITEDFETPIRGKSTVDVKTEPKNDHTVEKKRSFHNFSQVLFHFNISDNNGIV
jgi:hypothetical protein